LRLMMLSGTPKRGRYGLLWAAHNDWPKALPDKRFSIHAAYKDAPRQVSAQFVEELRQTREGSEATYRREYLCAFDAGERLVYPMFTPTCHVREPVPGQVWSEILVGVDHGFEDPGVFLVAGVIGQGKDAVVHVLEEVYESGHESGWWDAKAVEVAGRYAQF